MNWFDYLSLSPPPMPDIYLGPVPARHLPVIKMGIAAAYKMAFEWGLVKGFLVGVIATRMCWPRIERS